MSFLITFYDLSFTFPTKQKTNRIMIADLTESKFYHYINKILNTLVSYATYDPNCMFTYLPKNVFVHMGHIIRFAWTSQNSMPQIV